MSKTWTSIERRIYEENSYLLNVEKGQRFISQYYGIITATNIDYHKKGDSSIYSVYGYCSEKGLPRSCFARDLELIGKEIKLDDVLLWLCYKYEFSVTMKNGQLFLFGYAWNFEKSISDQQTDLIDYLLKL